MKFQLKASTTDDRVRVICEDSWKGTIHAKTPIAASLSDDEIKELGLNLLQSKAFVDDVNQFLFHPNIEIIRTHLIGVHDA
ncbi:hypothetical protein [Microcoleus sp. B4-C1]|uniref:hypothetical protein n=1 Tax=Microcoleus sp. B4-C1 TaxID=2818660 RepID=UPI002FD41A4A